MRALYVWILTAVFVVACGLPAEAGDATWSIGFGLNDAIAHSESDSVRDIDLAGVTLFGRWQHESGWGAMAEIRGGEDDERFTELEFRQVALCATYTWRRDKLARPFIKFGLANTAVDLDRGPRDDDTEGMLGGGIEIGRGHWAFHFSIDGTGADIDVIDPRKSSGFGASTLGVTFRF